MNELSVKTCCFLSMFSHSIGLPSIKNSYPAKPFPSTSMFTFTILFFVSQPLVLVVSSISSSLLKTTDLLFFPVFRFIPITPSRKIWLCLYTYLDRQCGCAPLRYYYKRLMCYRCNHHCCYCSCRGLHSRFL